MARAEAFGLLSVWLSLCFSLLAVLTAVLAGSVGQWMQITFFFLVAVVAAITSGPGDLTSLVFFGLGYSVAVAYRKIHRNAFRVYAPITLLYFGAFVVGSVPDLFSSPPLPTRWCR